MKTITKAVLVLALLASSLAARPARIQPHPGFSFLIALPSQIDIPGLQMYLKITVTMEGEVTHAIVFLPAGTVATNLP